MNANGRALATLPAPDIRRILIAEDEPEIRDYLLLALKRPDVVIDFAENGEEVLSSLGGNQPLPSLLIMDVAMPRKDGLATLRDIRREHPALPVIMLSGLSSTRNIVEAMKSGANDFLAKPASHEALWAAVDQLLPSAPPNSTSLPDAFLPDRRVASTPDAGAWRTGFEPLLARVSRSDVPVLLEGETGSGKEVVARQIHSKSLRAGQVFLKLNCAALPAELVESELFGYERGAFTGAFRDNPGKFELANGGTLLLDEIGDMDLKLQAKLLQVLQDQEFLRLGAREPTRIDVRVIAATHRDLPRQVAKGAFREDLYYRLNIIRIVIPPLRERRDEVLPLASFFLQKHDREASPVPPITPELKTAILEHLWPGNVRELENLMRLYLVVRDPSMIVEELRNRALGEDRPRGGILVARPEEGPGTMAAPARPNPPTTVPPAKWARVDEARKAAEREAIVEALNKSRWNRKRAAELLGTDYKALLYKMKKLRIG